MKKNTSNPNSNMPTAIWKFFFKIFDNLSKSFNTAKTIKRSYSLMTIITLAMISNLGVLQAQIGPGTVPVDPPAGGFNIDGTLKANSTIGDWLSGTGAGGFVLDSNGNPLVPETTFHLIDLYNSSLDNIFGGGVKIDDNPNNWSWVSGTANDKTDMNNALIHFTTDVSGNVWIVFAADRLGGENSSAYMDFEFLQEPMTLTSTGFSTSPLLSPTGGRTGGDFILTVYFESGVAKFDIQRWQDDGGVWKYVSIYSSLPANSVYAAGNTAPVSVPYTAFGSTTYANNTFIESAVDLTAVLTGIDPCADILVKTIFVKSKTSTSSSAQLKDFFEPLQVDFHLVTPGGSVSGGGVICSGDTSGLLTLSNHVGTVVRWESSVDPFSSWNDIANTSTTHTSDPLTVDTQFRAVVNGACGVVYSDPAIVTVNAIPTITGTTPSSRCGTGTVTLGATASAGTINWYAASSGGTSLGTGTSFTTPSISTTTTYYVDATAIGCTTGSRTAVIATVNAIPTITGTTPSSRCGTGTVTLGATASAGTINWYAASSGGTSLGTGTSFTTPSISTTTTYYVDATAIGCTTGSRTAVIATVNPLPVISREVPVCVGENITLSPTSGGTWTSSDDAIATITNAGVVTGVSAGSATFTFTLTATGCSSTSASVTVNYSPAPTGSVAQTFCSIDLKTVGDISVVGTGVIWYDAPTNGTVVPNSTVLPVGTTSYYATQTTGDCESDTRFKVDVTVNDPPAPTTENDSQSFCSIDLKTIADIAVTGIGIIWYDAESNGSVTPNGTVLPVGTTTYYASQTAEGCESDTRLAVTVTVADPSAPTGSATQSFCSIALPTVANLSPNGADIKWYLTASGGSPLTSATALTTATSYYATQTVGGCESDTRFKVDVTINNPLPPTGAAAQSFCSIALPTVANLAVIGTNVKWYLTVSGGTPLPPATPLTTITTYYATQTVGGCESDNRLAVTVTVADPLPPTTVNAAQVFCSIALPRVANLVATGTNVQWYLTASGGSLLLPTTPLTTATIYYATQIVGGCESDTRLAVNVTVSDPAAPTTVNAAQAFCAIDLPTVANLAIIGTNVKWYLTASGGAPLLSTTALTTATSYYATQTVGGCESDTRFKVDVTVNDPLPPTTVNTGQSFCSIDLPTVVNLAATGTNVIWYAAPTGGSPLPSATTLTTATTYYATQTVGGCESDTRLAVTVTVADPAAPTAVNAAQAFCSIDLPTVANLAVTGANIKWYLTASGGSPLLSTTALTTATSYYATQTVGGCESDTRFKVDITINDPLAPTTVNATQAFCSIDLKTVADIAVAGTGIIWYNGAINGNVVAPGTVLPVGTTTYYATQTSVSCESVTRLAVTVIVNNPPAPTTENDSQSFCTIDLKTIADINVTGTGIIWYDAAINGNVVAPDTVLPVGTTTYYATQTSGSCESDTRLAVTVTVADPAAPTTNNNLQSFCSIDLPTVADIEVTAGLGFTITWYDAATDGNVVPIETALTDNTTYYASQTIGSCESDTRLSVQVTVNDPVPPTSAAATQIFISTDSPTVGNINVTGTGIIWYDALINGNIVPNNTALVNGNTYYATQTIGGCESDTRLQVTVVIHIPPIILDDIAETESNIPINIDILDNDTDADGTIDPASVTIIEEPENGTVVVNTNGTVNYTSDLDFIGDDIFTYEVCDNDGLCDTATVNVVVAGVLAAELIIPQGFSPNDDGIHDEFDVEGLSNLYPDFKMVIYNRWGIIVYDYTHNGNTLSEPIWWDGYSRGRMTLGNGPAPVGTYFYTLYFNKDGAKPRSGYLYLNR